MTHLFDITCEIVNISPLLPGGGMLVFKPSSKVYFYAAQPGKKGIDQIRRLYH